MLPKEPNLIGADAAERQELIIEWIRALEHARQAQIEDAYEALQEALEKYGDEVHDAMYGLE